MACQRSAPQQSSLQPHRQPVQRRMKSAALPGQRDTSGLGLVLLLGCRPATRWPTATSTQHWWIAAVCGERLRRKGQGQQAPTNGSELRKQSLKTEVTAREGLRPLCGAPFPQTEEVTACRAASGGLPTSQVVAEDGPRPSRELVPDADTSESRSSAGAYWRSSARVGSPQIPTAQKPARGLPGGLLVLATGAPAAARWQLGRPSAPTVTAQPASAHADTAVRFVIGTMGKGHGSEAGRGVGAADETPTMGGRHRVLDRRQLDLPPRSRFCRNARWRGPLGWCGLFGRYASGDGCNGPSAPWVCPRPMPPLAEP
jgi:hypothetical protein